MNKYSNNTYAYGIHGSNKTSIIGSSQLNFIPEGNYVDPMGPNRLYFKTLILSKIVIFIRQTAITIRGRSYNVTLIEEKGLCIALYAPYKF